MNSFTAKHDGDCLYCYETVEQGEQAAFYKNDFMHFSCATEAEKEDKLEELKRMAE